MAINLASAYITIMPDTSKLAEGVKKSLRGLDADGKEAGKKIADGMSNAMKGKGKDAGGDFGKEITEAMQRAVEGGGTEVGKALGKEVSKSLDGEADKVGKSFGQKLSSAMGKAGSSVVDFSNKFKVHAGVALGGLTALGKGAADYAAEAEQSYGAVESIFGEHSAKINNLSKNAADSVGLSGREYREQASYMGAMLKNLGTPMEELGGKSADLVAMGADLAATFGGPTSDAVSALGAVLRGETDPIERYGISIKQADIKAKMAEMGLDGLTGEAEKQAQAQATLALLTEQSASAQGQFARETDTAAHKTQVAKAKLDDAKETIGTALLPVMAMVTEAFAKVSEQVGKHPKLFLALAGAVGAVSAAIVGISAVSSAVSALGGMAKIASVASKAMTVLTGPIGLVVAAIAAVVAGLVLFFTKTETGRKMWASFTEALGKGWDWVVEKFKAGAEWVKTAFEGLKDLFVNGDFTGALRDAFGWEEDSPIVDTLLDLRDKFILVKDAAVDFWKILSGSAQQGETEGLAKLIGADNAEIVVSTITNIRDALSTAKDKAVEFGKAAGDFIGKTFGKIKEIIAPLMPVIADLMRSIGGALLGAFKALWGVVKSLWKTFKTLWDVLSPLLLPILKIVGAVVGGVLVGAFLIMLGALKLVAKAAELLLKAFTWLLDNAIAPLIKFVGDLASGLIDGLGGAIGWVADIAPKLWNGIKDGASGLWDALTGVWNGIKDGAVGAWDGIIGAITGAWDGVTGVIGGAFSWIQSTIIEPLVSFVTGTLIPTVTNIFTTISDKWEALKGWLQTVGADFLAVLQDAWNVIVAFFTGDKEDVYAALGELWESLRTLTTDVWNGIRDALVELWNGLVETATTVWTAIKDAIVNVWNGLKDSITSAWQATWDFIVNVWKGIPGFAASVWEAVKGAVVNAWNGMMSFISGIGPAIRDFVANVWSSIKDTSQAKWQEIKNVVLNAWSALRTGISNAIQALRDRINSFVNNAREAFGRFVSNVEQVPGKIKAAFANAGTWLLDAGKNIIRGLANGVRNAAGIVEDAIRAVIPDSVERFVPGLHLGGLAGFARGGVLPAIPGVSNSQRDPILGWSAERKQPIARVEPGEFIVNRESTKKYLPLLAAINGGKLNGRKGDLGLPGYADGGIVNPDKLLKFAKGAEVDGYRASQPLEGAPYVWGGSNWGDCSGAMSQLAAVVSGAASPYTRKFATGSQEAWLSANGFKSGLGSGPRFATGFFNGGPWSGHTAGTIFFGGGKRVNVEMGGGRGNGQIGGGAAGADDSQFTDRYYYPFKGVDLGDDVNITSTSTDGVTVESDKYKNKQIDWGTAEGLFSEWEKKKNRREKLNRWNAGIFDTGGILKPGNIAINRSGRPERILNPTLTKAFESLAKTAPQLAKSMEKYVAFAEKQVGSAPGNIRAYLGSLSATEGLDLADRVGKLFGIDGIKSTFGGVADAWTGLEDAAIRQVDAADAVKQAEENVAKARAEGDAEAQAEAEKDLAKAHKTVGLAAAAAGQAQIEMALAIAELVVNIVKRVIEGINDIAQRILKAQAEAYNAIADSFAAIGKLADTVQNLRENVAGLMLDQTMAQIELAAAVRNVRIAQMDGVTAQLEGAKTLAEAQAAFDAQRKADMRLAAADYSDLSLAYDRFRFGMVGANKEAMDQMANWSDKSHALYSELLAAQVNQQLVEREAQKANLEAVYKHTLAALSLRDVTANLNVAAQKLAAAAGSAFGMDQIGATVGQRYAALMAEKAKLIANQANIKTWINPVNWFTTMPAAQRRIKQIESQLKQLEQMEEFKKLDQNALADMKKTVGQAGWMGFFGAGDQIEGMIKNSPLGDANRALEEIEFKNRLIDLKAAQDELRRKTEKSLAEIEHRKKLDPLETLIQSLKAEKDSHKTWAEYWRTDNEAVRKALADLAKHQADSAAELKKLSENREPIKLYGDTVSMDEVQRMLTDLGHRVERVENPPTSAAAVSEARR